MHKPKALTLRQLFLLKPKQWLLAWTIGLVTLFATIGLLSASGWFISAAAFAGIVAGGSAISFDFFRPAAVIRAFAITRTAGRYGERLASHHAVLSLLTGLRVYFFKSIAFTKLNAKTKNFHSSDALQRLTHDIDQLDELPLRVWAPWIWAVTLQFLFLIVVAAFNLTLAKIISLPLLLSGIFVPLLGIFIGFNIAKQKTNLAEERRRHLLDPLTASTSLILWQQWQRFQTIFHQSDKRYNALFEKERLIGLFLNVAQQICLATVIILLIWQAYPLINDGSFSVAVLLAMVLAVLGLNEIILPLGSSFSSLGFAIASKERLNAITHNEYQEINLNDNISNYQLNTGKNLFLNVSNVSVKHPSALSGAKNVSFELKTGETLFIKGRSGAGKSTLLYALADELAINDGQIIAHQKQANDKPSIGFLDQQIDIFNLTLAENLRIGKFDASDEELWQALDKVKLSSWAKNQPLQLNTAMGEYGLGISGGQARRIALARLLLKPYDMLLLDEPFAGVDSGSAEHIYTALRKQQENGLLIIVSHAYSTPIDAKLLKI